jgi:hypothetical protein
MAAGTWKVFNEAKKHLGKGEINLNGTAFRLAIFQATSNLASVGSALPLTIYNAITNEVANGNNYVTGGFALGGEGWTVGRSAKEFKFRSSNLLFTAEGGTIPNIMFGAIYISAAASANRFLVCYVTLSSSQFTLAQNNTCTITCPTNGIFMLV